MSNIEARGLARQDTPRLIDDGTYAYPKLNHRGELCVIDFYTQMAMEKRGFEIRCGIDSATETGDAPIASTACEFAINLVSGLTVIPTFFNVAIVDGPGTVHMIALKVINAASTGGTAFVPLPLWADSTIGPVSTALANDEGGCACTADALTTTNCLYMNGAATALGAYQLSCQWQPLLPAIVAGAGSVYAQIGSTTTGPEYHATLQYIEIPTTALE